MREVGKVASIAFVILLLIGVRIVSAQTPSVLTFSDITVIEGDSSIVELRLDVAPEGLAGFIIHIEIPDNARLNIAEVNSQFPLNRVDKVPPVVIIGGIDLNRTFQEGSTQILLATLDVLGTQVGVDSLQVNAIIIDDDGGFSIPVSVVGGVITVTRRFPTLEGESGPVADLDGDGLAEDLNANGRFDFADIILLFVHKFSVEVTDNIDLFDYNASGDVDFDDVVSMFRHIVGA